jgi:hypothetical protein
MRGSIRTFAGLVVVMFAAGGIDNATDGQLGLIVLVAIAGLTVMASGVYAMNRK